ncbi:MAG: c-type cytochrome [Gammaproteobacteria bacterium]
MTKIILIAGALLSFAGASFAGGHSGADVGADIAKAETCIQCHESMGMSLKGGGADAIAGKIKAIGAGGTSHPAVMEGASDADIAEVAKILNEKG